MIRKTRTLLRKRDLLKMSLAHLQKGPLLKVQLVRPQITRTAQRRGPQIIKMMMHQKIRVRAKAKLPAAIMPQMIARGLARKKMKMPLMERAYQIKKAKMVKPTLLSQKTERKTRMLRKEKKPALLVIKIRNHLAALGKTQEKIPRKRMQGIKALSPADQKQKDRATLTPKPVCQEKAAVEEVA